LRSESEVELGKIESFLRESVQSGIDEEMSAARDRGMAGGTSMLDLKISVLGVRPPENCRRPRRFWPLCWRPTPGWGIARGASVPRPMRISRCRSASRRFPSGQEAGAAAPIRPRNGSSRPGASWVCSASH